MPNGYYCEDLIVYGGLNRGCQVTQGFEIFTPDLRHASNAARVDAHNALMQLLSATSDLKQIQFRWKVDSDYSEALLRYQQETDKAENVWSKTCRNERFYRYMDRMRRRELRRERLPYLFDDRDQKHRAYFYQPRKFADEIPQGMAPPEKQLSRVRSRHSDRVWLRYTHQAARRL